MSECIKRNTDYFVLMEKVPFNLPVLIDGWSTHSSVACDMLAVSESNDVEDTFILVYSIDCSGAGLFCGLLRLFCGFGIR